MKDQVCSCRCRARCAWSVAVVAFFAGSAMGQYATTLDGLNGDPLGTVLTGQDGWYLPAAGGVDHKVYTYAGNTIGVTANPNGGSQFAGAISNPGNIFGRAQRDTTFSDRTRAWYDVFVINNGTAVNNAGSFSLQDSVTTAAYIHLFSYPAGAPVTTYAGGYLAYSAAGVQALAPGLLPGPEWSPLDTGTWYKFETSIDFTANLITDVAITNLSTNTRTSVAVTDYYLQGGAAGGRPRPTGFRMFSGAETNTVAWDNLTVTCYADLDTSTGVGALDIFDFLAFGNYFANSDPVACECDRSTGQNVCDIFDFLCFGNLFDAGCP